ncbi:MAG: efflux RND transporter permease subunit [Rhodomicrobium sp.]
MCQDTIAIALGGEAVTTTVEGRERYTVNVRYPRDLRSDPQAIAREVLVPMPSGGAVPLGEVAHVQQNRGPNTIRTENAELAVYIYVDMQGRYAPVRHCLSPIARVCRLNTDLARNAQIQEMCDPMLTSGSCIPKG